VDAFMQDGLVYIITDVAEKRSLNEYHLKKKYEFPVKEETLLRYLL